MTKNITQATRLTVLKHLAKGKSPEVVAAAPKLDRFEVINIGSHHGYPGPEKLTKAVDIITRNLDQQALEALPPATAPATSTPPASRPTQPRVPAQRTGTRGQGRLTMSTSPIAVPGASAVPAAEAFTDAVLSTITSATWPDGSALVDVDETVLRRALGPRIRATAYALAATAALTAGSTLPGGPR